MCVTATVKRRRKQSKVGFRGTMHPMRRPRIKLKTASALDRKEALRKAKAVTGKKKSSKR